MTKQEIKDAAVANGYVLGTKTDAELLTDARFFKAAFGGGEAELGIAYKNKTCPNGCGVVTGRPRWRNCLLESLDALDAGKSTDEVWAILETRKGVLVSEVKKKDGSLDTDKL